MIGGGSHNGQQIRPSQAKRSVYEKITSYQVLSGPLGSLTEDLRLDLRSPAQVIQSLAVPEVVQITSSSGGSVGWETGLKRTRKRQRTFIGRLKRARIAFECQRLVAISQFYVK